MWKQIIIVRKDLNMTHGKMAAQVSHGSMAFLSWMVRDNTKKVCKNYLPTYVKGIDGSMEAQYFKRGDLNRLAFEARDKNLTGFYASRGEDGIYKLAEPEYVYQADFEVDNGLFENWLSGAFTKCVLEAKNRIRLLKAKEMAESLGMEEGKDFFLIRDNCYTELTPEDEDGRTLTCIGFRPMPEEEIDPIGKKFHLYVG